MTGEQGLAMLLKVSLIGVKKTIQPREELLGTVVGMEDDRDSISWSNGTNVHGAGNTTGNGGLLFAVGYTLRKFYQYFL